MFEPDIQDGLDESPYTIPASIDPPATASGKKTAWMIAGNKGGVGKSFFCQALASTFEIMGGEHSHYAILDGDGRTGDVHASFVHKVPSRLVDFRELRAEHHSCMEDGEYEKHILWLMKANTHLIINTPDGADNVLMRWFDETLKQTEQNNIQFKMIYLMSDRPDGMSLVPELSKRFAYFFPVRNLYFGSVDVFSAFNEKLANKYRQVFDFPKLRANEVRMMFDNKTYPAEFTRNKKNHVLSRQRVLNWAIEVGDIVEMLVRAQEANYIGGESD